MHWLSYDHWHLRGNLKNDDLGDHHWLVNRELRFRVISQDYKQSLRVSGNIYKNILFHYRVLSQFKADPSYRDDKATSTGIGESVCIGKENLETQDPQFYPGPPTYP
jgi:hypothetical protein